MEKHKDIKTVLDRAKPKSLDEAYVVVANSGWGEPHGVDKEGRHHISRLSAAAAAEVRTWWKNRPR